ncbi:DUF6907 domain-containing protein [Streptomyces zaomyceticus]|uniref:DUF6907 domain-containing protein n=1 Tax=Streptomyces zaomyceticus TaxID=68286 RepID=UPI0036A7B64B
MSNTVQRAAHIPTEVLPVIPAQTDDRNSVPGISSPVRVMPAVVGKAGAAQRIYVECPDFCGVDHTKGYVELEDITHYSASDVAQVLTFLDDTTSHSDLTATIALDPTAEDPRKREAHLVVDTGTFEEARLTPAMAEELADDLIAFASQLRHKARQVAAFNRKQARR